MNKQQFLDALRRGLSQLPTEEIEKQTAYYSELIDDMIEDGMTEYDAVERLGSVQEIYENILQDMPLPLLVKTKVRPRGGWTQLTVLLIILAFPLLLSLAAIVLTALFVVYVSVWALVVAAFAAVLGIVLAAAAFVVLFIRLLFSSLSAALFALGLALVLGGIALAAGLLTVTCCKLIIRATAALGRRIKKLFIRKES